MLLSDGELDKLKHRFPNYLERIDKESPSMQICREGDICYIKRTIGMPLIGTKSVLISTFVFGTWLQVVAFVQIHQKQNIGRYRQF
ncbi:MAG: hypothetical protein HFE65_07505 [Clostridiales bacterium]|nr:hypothetical protein [Clostridiales bacterium]